MRKTWMACTLAGEAANIDDEVSAWHECREMPLPHLSRWLGMTGEEYELFVKSPEALPAIVGRRAAMERKEWARLVKATAGGTTGNVADAGAWLREVLTEMACLADTTVAPAARSKAAERLEDLALVGVERGHIAALLRDD